MVMVDRITFGLAYVAKVINRKLFGKNLLVTNCIISAGMGSLGDAIQQHYDIVTESIKKAQEPAKFNFKRNFHMTLAGLTTGLVSHHWYILLDNYLGSKRCLKLVTAKVLLDQILFSPVNLLVYFSTLGICERSSVSRVKDELVEKGLENIYIAEWVIWPPAQYINFYILPLKYRILFDNIVSLGFDIYSPYVKYNKELTRDQRFDKSEKALLQS